MLHSLHLGPFLDTAEAEVMGATVRLSQFTLFELSETYWAGFTAGD